MKRTYKASELIGKIQKLIAEHGDLPVIADDPDTDWRLEIGIVFKPENQKEGLPERFEIKTDYHKRPKGNVDE